MSLAILDWGVGGVGFFKELRRRMPAVPVTYLSDTGAVPYGKQRADQLANRVAFVARLLADSGATHLVIACNAASTVLERKAFAAGLPLQVCGVIRPALAAVANSDAKRVGVVGGGRTIRSGIYRRLLETPERQVIQRIAQPLSGLIEAGKQKSPELTRELTRILAPLRAIDTLVLGCTHYPAISDAFRMVLPHARQIDPALETVGWIGRHWNLPAGNTADRFLTTGDPAAMARAALLAFDVTIPQIESLQSPS